ncbi:MAG: sel1 repeat family protein [Rhodobiaceae bacterium]|nr:sel1 repeat family protein [Rhodobiaceae bacterium]MCC0062445.1 sel1 repeat family protein [Rhodobiaceae bacterium]
MRAIPPCHIAWKPTGPSRWRAVVLAAFLTAAPCTTLHAETAQPKQQQTPEQREAAPARMLKQARQLTDTALAATGSARISGLSAALDTLIDIVDKHPKSDIAVQLRGGRSIDGLSIAGLSTLLSGLTDGDPLTAAQAEALADARERAARDDTMPEESGTPLTTGSINPAPDDVAILEPEAPSMPVPDDHLSLAPDEAVAACDRLAASPNDATRTADGIWQTVMDTDAAVLACTQAVKAAPDNARLKFQLGRAVYRSGKAADAALLFGQAATQGHLSAQAQLGLMLIAGDGMERDAARGYALVKAAADKSDPFAIAMLGELTTHGIGTVKDETAGLELYRKAAELGSPIGMQRLGETLAERQAGPETDADALDWLNKAVAAGAPTAHHMIGVLIRDGRGVRKDAAAAFSHFRMAAMAGDARALYEVGAAYMNGRGVKADQREGVSWMRRAAQAGLSDSYYSLAYAHAFGRGADRNPKEAARYMFLSLKARSETAFGQMTRNPEQWPPDMRRELQQIMKDQGVYSSSVDGSFGPATLQAIAALAGS